MRTLLINQDISLSGLMAKGTIQTIRKQNNISFVSKDKSIKNVAMVTN